VITFCFGLVHGFGFSFALKETLQFAGSHLLTSLLSFNVGVELGQLLVLVILIPVLNFALRRVVAERLGIIIVSALIAHTAWHWMIERGSTLGEYDWSGLKPDTPGNVVRWIMAAVLVAAAVWVLRQGKAQGQRPKAQGEGLKAQGPGPKAQEEHLS
jgi:formate/nitrite transporter FocA (FNT family)